MKKYIRFEHVVSVSFIIISFLLVSEWFYQGTFLATGESALPFYNLPLQFLRLQHSWGMTFLGNYTGQNFSDYIFYGLLAALASVLPGTIVQALFFFVIINCMVFSYYNLANLFISDKRITFFASLFYVCNLFVMVNIWSRFQYTYMLFYAFMPLGLFVFIKGLHTKNYVYAIVFGFISVLFAELFASIPHFMLFWGVLFFYLVCHLFSEKKDYIFSCLYFVFTVVFFLLLQAFWLLPFIQSLFTTAYITTEAYTASGDFATFSILSNRLGNLSYILRMMHVDYFIGKSTTWGNLYFNPILIVISYLVPFFVISSILFKQYTKQISFFICLGIFAIFFSKGDAPPVGFIADFLFTHYRILEAFRNSFEKIGVLIPFAFALPLGVTIFAMYDRLTKNKVLANTFLGVCIIGILFLLMFPFWNGWIFSQPSYPGLSPVTKQVQVPAYYHQADVWLSKNSHDLRTIALPLGGEGMTYTWPKGYSGVELSNTLFSTPFISINTTVPFAGDIVPNIETLLLNFPSDFWKSSVILGADKVMVREDVDSAIENLRSPKLFSSLLAHNQQFRKSASFGPLTFYSLQDQLRVPRIYSANRAVEISGDMIGELPFVNITPHTTLVNTTDSHFTEESLVNQRIIQGQSINTSPIISDNNQAISTLPTTFLVPGFRLYFFSVIRDFFNSHGFSENKTVASMIKKSGQQIYILWTLQQKNNYSYEDAVLKEYNSDIDYLSNHPFNPDDSQTQLLFAEKFILGQLINSSPVTYKQSITSSYQKISQLLHQLNLSPEYPVSSTIFSFTLPQNGKYSLIIPEYQFVHPEELVGKPMSIFIDGKKEQTTVQINGKGIHFGEWNFDKGKHEIGLDIPASVNVISQDVSEKYIVASQSAKVLSYPLSMLDSDASYKISLDVNLRQGKSPQEQLIKNTKNLLDPTDSVKQPFFRKNFYPYSHWETISFTQSPGKATKGEFAIFSEPNNTCHDKQAIYLFGLFHRTEKSCKDSAYRNLFNQPTVVGIKNVIITKNPSYHVYLEMTGKSVTLSIPKISYQKINPAKYIVTVSHASSQFLLVFLDTYHTLWQASYLENHQVIKPKDHFLANGFANGWTINKKGNYQIMLEFSSENTFVFGKTVSLISGIVGILLLAVIIIRKRI